MSRNGEYPTYHINPDVIDEVLNVNEDDGGTLSAEQNADPTLKEALSLAARYHRHVNNLRPFTARVEDIQTDSVPCDVGDDPVASVTNCSVIFEQDVDFGKVVVLEPNNYKNT